MPSHPQSSEPGARPAEELDELVFECLERVEREGPAALREICHAHAQLAPALLERVRALLESGLFDVGESPRSAAPTSDAPGAREERL